MDRLAGDGGTTISKKMEREPIRGIHEVEVRDDHGRVSTAKVHVRFCRMTVHPPIGKQKRYPTLSLTVIHADERGTPAGREPIRWRLLTDLPVDDLAAAIEKLDWYAQRWKIETFHKVLKSGLPGRAVQAPHGRAADEPAGRALRHRLAGVLADDGEPGDARGPGRGRLDEGGDRDPGPPGRGHEPAREADGVPLPRGGRQAGRLPGAGEGPAAGEHGDLAGLTRLMDIHLGFELRSRVVGN